jgi:branched-chain amino acid transport system ATP-binding protein
MLLDVHGLEAGHGDLLALRGLDFRLEAGRTLAIVGANGAGKSTLLRCLAGAHVRRRGQIRFEGQSLEGLPAHRVAALGISLVPEGRRLFASLGVEENLLLGGQAGRPGHWNLRRIYELFPRLADRRDVQSTKLSGGEQQMVAIGRALMANPKLLLCDEVSLGLAPVVIQELYGHLARIRAAGTSLLLVEQDLGRALGASDELLCLTEGRIVLAGASASVSREQVAAAYFGVAA